MKKIAMLSFVLIILLSLSSCFYPIDYDPKYCTNTESEQTTEKRADLSNIVIYNVEMNRLYGVDLEEVFYLYVMPYAWNEKDVVNPEDVTLVAVNEEGLVDIEFLQKCADGSFKYKVTAVKVGNCEIYAKETYGYADSEKFSLSIRDYDTMNIKYCCTDDFDYFHFPTCEIYSKLNLQERFPTTFTRNELRDKGMLPCKECCG